MKPCRGSIFQKGNAFHLIARPEACRTLVTNHISFSFCSCSLYISIATFLTDIHWALAMNALWKGDRDSERGYILYSETKITVNKGSVV